MAKQIAFAGRCSDGDSLAVPEGTVDNWVIIVSPEAMGRNEDGSEGDNALLRFECSAVVEGPYGWTVTARSKFRGMNEPPGGSGTWHPSSATYLIVRKQLD
ncbi:hypothetical protein [Nannocystis punicea]|uniref:Uncharacterized protein n=1 Tax=Nannocystis punicea TaxID=2995304 RepID=A0ABY7H7Y3_9BACT|nr:hypothetical protein [Nannocystis poenicansa]WAS95268.1 hypothetical protein O0S08_03835 [Nannocystis poenicansa]